MVKKIIFPEADKEDLTYVGDDFFLEICFWKRLLTKHG